MPRCPTRSPRRVWLGHLNQAEQHSAPFHRSLRSDSRSDNIAVCLTSPANTGSGLTGGRSVTHPSSTGLFGQRGTSHTKIPRNGRNTHIAPKRSQPAANASTHTHTVATNNGGRGGRKNHNIVLDENISWLSWYRQSSGKPHISPSVP